MKSLRLGGSGSAAVFLAMSKPSSRLSWRRHCRRSDRTAPSPSSSPGATAVGGPPVRPHALTHLQRNVGYFRFVRTSRRCAICASVTTGSRAERRRADRDAVSRAGGSRDDNGSAGHGSRVKWVNNMSGSRGSRVSTRDPLTHDFVLFSHCRDLRHSLSDNRQFNSIVSTGYFVAVMTFHFESTST